MDFFNINKFSVYSISFNVIHWLMPSKLYLCLLVLYLICVVAWSCPGSMWSGEIFVKRSSNIGWIVFWLRLEAMTRCLGWVLLTEWDYLSVVGCVVWMTVVTERWGGWVSVWLGLWMGVWLCVWWAEWEMAGCVLDWVMGWLCVDCAVRCLRGVWGQLWLGPWMSVWLCVWWGEWGWLPVFFTEWWNDCVDCAVRCLRGVWGHVCMVGSMSECVFGCGGVSGGCWVVSCIGDALTHYTQYIYPVFSWKTRVGTGHKKALKGLICILENIRL